MQILCFRWHFCIDFHLILGILTETACKKQNVCIPGTASFSVTTGKRIKAKSWRRNQKSREAAVVTKHWWHCPGFASESSIPLQAGRRQDKSQQ